MFDVVVSEAGPAGNHTAKCLGELGYRVVVKEHYNLRTFIGVGVRLKLRAIVDSSKAYCNFNE